MAASGAAASIRMPAFCSSRGTMLIQEHPDQGKNPAEFRRGQFGECRIDQGEFLRPLAQIASPRLEHVSLTADEPGKVDAATGAIGRKHRGSRLAVSTLIIGKRFFAD